MNDKTGERKVVPLRKSRKCPICDKPSDPAYYPFCSDRCQSIDLNRWLSGAYAIPAVEAEDDSADEFAPSPPFPSDGRDD